MFSVSKSQRLCFFSLEQNLSCPSQWATVRWQRNRGPLTLMPHVALADKCHTLLRNSSVLLSANKWYLLVNKHNHDRVETAEGTQGILLPHAAQCTGGLDLATDLGISGKKMSKIILNHHWCLGDSVCEVGVGVDFKLNRFLISLPCWFTQSKPHPGQITKKKKTELLRMQKPHCCSAINQFTLSLNVKLIFFLEPATSLPSFPPQELRLQKGDLPLQQCLNSAQGIEENSHGWEVNANRTVPIVKIALGSHECWLWGALILGSWPN